MFGEEEGRKCFPDTQKRGIFFSVPFAPAVVDVLSPKLFSPREGREGKE